MKRISLKSIALIFSLNSASTFALDTNTKEESRFGTSTHCAEEAAMFATREVLKLLADEYPIHIGLHNLNNAVYSISTKIVSIENTSPEDKLKDFRAVQSFKVVIEGALSTTGSTAGASKDFYDVTLKLKDNGTRMRWTCEPEGQIDVKEVTKF